MKRLGSDERPLCLVWPQPWQQPTASANCSTAPSLSPTEVCSSGWRSVSSSLHTLPTLGYRGEWILSISRTIVRIGRCKLGSIAVRIKPINSIGAEAAKPIPAQSGV